MESIPPKAAPLDLPTNSSCGLQGKAAAVLANIAYVP
jgi:hypothetical protein